MKYVVRDGRFDVKFGYDEFTEANRVYRTGMAVI